MKIKDERELREEKSFKKQLIHKSNMLVFFVCLFFYWCAVRFNIFSFGDILCSESVFLVLNIMGPDETCLLVLKNTIEKINSNTSFKKS